MATLAQCVARVRAIASEDLALEIVIVDDASTDDSLATAGDLADRHPEVKVYSHEVNQGKGAALRTGFSKVTGDFVAVQDADLEYDPNDLVRLLEPLIAGKADVAFGSRYLSTGPHRVLYFWHSVGNQFLTLISNIFTDLNLTDMETCYKVFKREVIQSIEIEEDRFGFEPEIVAKLADRRLRIYEMGISYDGRTYAEGKKIGISDAFRALYCVFRYNARSAPIALQFVLYCLIGGIAALANLALFGLMHAADTPLVVSAPTAFGIAAIVNYLLCQRPLEEHHRVVALCARRHRDGYGRLRIDAMAHRRAIRSYGCQGDCDSIAARHELRRASIPGIPVSEERTMGSWSQPRFPRILVSSHCRFCQTTLEHSVIDLGVTPLCQKHVSPADFMLAITRR